MKINIRREASKQKFGNLKAGDVFIERDSNGNSYIQMKITPNSEGNAVVLTSGSIYPVKDDLMVELIEAELNIL